MRWVRIHTDSGLYGLGETYPRPGSEEAVIHLRLASRLLGHDAGRIEGGAGAEMRAISPVDTGEWARS